MKRIFLAFWFIALSAAAHAQAGKITVPYAGAPDYCYWLTAQQCAKAIEIVATGEKPAWCAQGWGGKEAGLSEEQQRVCWHYMNLEIDKKPYVDPGEPRRRQLIADAIAGVKAKWSGQTDVIKTIFVAYKCGVIDPTSTNVSIAKVQVIMGDMAVRAGVDTTLPELNIKAATDAARDTAEGLVKNGLCDRLTPEWRGQIRVAVGALVAGRPMP